MALSSFAGNFAINTSTGNQAITGVGFTPKIVLFYPTIQTADGVVVDAYASFGAGISSTERAAISCNSEDAQATSDTRRKTDTALCFTVATPGTNTVLYEADFVSQDGDGFTINVSTAPGSGFRVGFLALGGADLTNVAIGNFAANTSDGNQAVTGVGFQPEAMLNFGINNPAPADSDINNWVFSFGGAISSTERFATAHSSRNSQATSVAKRRGSADAVYYGLNNAGTERSIADFVSFDADGFTWNWTPAPASADIIFFVCFAGGQYDVGEIQSQTGTGNFSTTGVGFQPTGGMWTSAHVANSTIASGNELSLGVASASGEQFAASETDEDGQGTTDADSQSDDGRVYLNYDYNQTKEGDIAFVSYDADGFTLDQTDADPSQFDIYFIVFGSDSVAAGNPWYAYAQQ